MVQSDEGIYHIIGLAQISIRLIAMNELSESDMLSLKVMVRDADEANVRAFIEESQKYSNPGDKSDADAVLQVSYSANLSLFRRLRGDEKMCEGLRELMAEDLEEKLNEGISLGIAGAVATLRKHGIDNATIIADICDQFGLTEKEAKKYL